MTTRRFARDQAGRLLLIGFCWFLPPGRASAQDSVLALRPNAQVGSVSFHFTGEQSFPAKQLAGLLEVRSRGSLYDVRRVLGELPLVPSPGPYLFDPVELQKDVVRLRRFYQRAGFFDPKVDYDVGANGTGSVVKVVYLIDEGPAATLRTIGVTGPEGAPGLTLPDSLREEWRRFEQGLAGIRGHRFGEADLLAAQAQTLGWLHDRGYPFATVSGIRAVDSAQRTADVTLQTDPGPRSRIGRIVVEEGAPVSDRVVLRELPFQTGDWYSATALAAGRTRLQSVDLLTQSVMDVDSQPAPDSALGVRIRLGNVRPRVTLAELGYVSDGPGLTGRVQWTHPNFTGGARSLAMSLEGQSGVGVVGTEAEQLLRGSLTLTQPYVFMPRLSFVVGPYAEYRDDLQDRSAAIGGTATLIYRLGVLSSLALQYELSSRHVYEYRFGDVSAGDVSLFELLSLQNPALIDSLGRDLDKSTLTLVSALGKLDNLADPRRGWMIRPAAEVTVPSALTTVEFYRLDFTGSAFQPLGERVTLGARLSVGRLFPFGKSVPPEGTDPTFAFIRLRDESMTAGGTNDVRGWADRMLGPKVPDAEAKIQGTDTVLVADRYAPIGALARLTASLELRFPAPGFSPSWQAHVFVDGGRVWTPDQRFSQSPLLPGETDFRVSLGVGLSYQTPVGALGLNLGYKLNPSPVDVRDAGDVLNALVAGQPITSVPENWRQRFHLHVMFGAPL